MEGVATSSVEDQTCAAAGVPAQDQQSRLPNLGDETFGHYLTACKVFTVQRGHGEAIEESSKVCQHPTCQPKGISEPVQIHTRHQEVSGTHRRQLTILFTPLASRR